MLRRIEAFFDRYLVPEINDRTRDTEHVLRLATGALLLEMTHMDGEVWPEQRQVVKQAMLEQFDLTESESTELLDLAEEERVQSTDYFQFTSLINNAYTPEQKIRLIELLWQIAYANESLHRYEEHLVRKIADLLHVPHGAFIAAKHRMESGRFRRPGR